MSFSVSFCLISSEVRSKKKEILRIAGDLAKIERDVLTITGPANPVEEFQIEGAKFSVSPPQRVLLEIVNTCQWKSISLLYARKPSAELSNTLIVCSTMLESSDGCITVKPGDGFLDTLVLLTTILQREEIEDGHMIDQCSSKKMKYGDDVKFRVLCPAFRVSSLIGKNGVNIRDIGHKTSAYVTVLTEVESYHKYRIVEIIGSGRKKCSLRDLNIDGSYAQMGLVSVAAAIMESDFEQTACILVDCDSLRKEDLQSISEDSGAQLKVKSAPAIANAGEVVIKVKGMRHDVLTGLLSVTALIQQQQEPKSTPL